MLFLKNKNNHHHLRNYFGTILPTRNNLDGNRDKYMAIWNCKSKIEKIGLFDMDFFMYSEEFEWCNRMLKNGLTLKVYDDIFIYHLEEGSSMSKEWNIKQRYLSSALLFKKTHGSFGLLLYLSLHFLNLLTNSILMWKLDKKYRNEFFCT